jgi:hypothetical protein
MTFCYDLFSILLVIFCLKSSYVLFEHLGSQFPEILFKLHFIVLDML